VTNRTDSLAALSAVATQGEANTSPDDDAPSHFARFLGIFRKFPRAAEWSPSRKVPRDPYVTTRSGTGSPSQEGTVISHPVSALWAHLFNVRYRTLLTNLLHTFDFPNNLSPTAQTTPRGLLIHSTFGEMYNIRALSEILMSAPLKSGKGDEKAGPPFQMPYTLHLPVDPVDRWHLHLDLLGSSRLIVNQLLAVGAAEHRVYLQTLQTVDDQTEAIINALLAGTSMPVPVSNRYH
jgi:hypothetical protein